MLPPAIYLALLAEHAPRAAARPAAKAAHVVLLVLGALVTAGATAKVLADKLGPR